MQSDNTLPIQAGQPAIPLTPSDLETQEAEQGPSDGERRLILWITNVSHATNHFQNQMVTVMYPVILPALGFGIVQLGIVSAVRNIFGSWSQLGYGFLTPFFEKCRLLALGNFVLALGTLLSGVSTGFVSFTAARCLNAVGGSAQHPVGSSLLSSYFPKSRGSILALNTSISGIGNLVAPLVAVYLMSVVGWRNTFFVVALFSVFMGIAYLFFRDKVSDTSRQTGDSKAKLAQGWGSYVRVLKNRNMMLIALVFMVGGAGRGEVTPIYLSPHLVSDLGFTLPFVAVALTTLQVGGLVGPLFFGWLSDRLPRTLVMQTTLVLSCITTFWLAWQGANGPLILLSLLIYGAFTNSRGTLTQALVADSASDADRDAAFSLYFFLGFISSPIWLLLTGVLMDRSGFGVAFSVLSVSYVGAILLLFFVKDQRPTATTAA